MRKLLLLALLLPRLAWGAIAYVQNVATTTGGTSWTSPVTGFTNGNRLLVFFSNWNRGTEVISSVTDNGSTSYAFVGAIDHGSGGSYTEVWAGVAAGSPTQVTVNVSGTPDHTSRHYGVVEYSGVAALGNVFTDGVDSGGNIATATVTTQDSNNVLAAVFTDGPGSSGGWTLVTGTALRYSDTVTGVADNTVASPSSVSVVLDMIGDPDAWTVVGVELRSTVGSASVPRRTLMGVGQ